ncbi:hypothetical protein A1OK_13575 [Enterovibrio norvegicus FF-454]|uniref:Uncharacterized protein n=1 Tax=Enterovibrio norvegicus FF-454 TaxID=1185651 RepID=A0A1E5C2I3_9GAMM|nr:hypothetical protein A1OK_13575 [Enterovibrio norvegicus FF-454]
MQDGENTTKTVQESQPKPEINHELLLIWRSNARQGEKMLGDKVELEKIVRIAHRSVGVYFTVLWIFKDRARSTFVSSRFVM